MSSPFMRLPPELRVRIYNMVVVLDEPVLIEMTQRRKWHSIKKSTTRSGKSMRPKQDELEDRRNMGHTALAVAFICRQVYLEATPRYYALNTFTLSQLLFGPSIESFFVDIGSRNRDMIVKVQLNCLYPWRYLHLENLRGARSLTLVPSSWYYGLLFPGPNWQENWIEGAKELCKTMKTLERVNVAPPHPGSWAGKDIRKPDLFALTGTEEGDKAIEMELNRVLQAQKQVQE